MKKNQNIGTKSAFTSTKYSQSNCVSEFVVKEMVQ